jgi:hypothetical protein
MSKSPYAGRHFSPIGYEETGGGILASTNPAAKIADIIKRR